MCESITPLAMPVVPDVNSSAHIASLSITTSIKSLFPPRSRVFPSDLISSQLRTPSPASEGFMHIFTDGPSSRPSRDSITFLASLFEKTIASGFALFMRFLISISVSSLSRGTITPVPLVTARYVTTHL